jgi:glycosyltransferase involved in cell wall biosynthesis
MPAIDQFVAGFANGDAISNEAVVLRQIFRSWGRESEIFCESKRILPELRKDSRDLGDYIACRKPDDIVLLHLSIGSAANELFASLPCRKAILYHNVTPPHYFDMINKRTSYDLAKGIAQVKQLADTAKVNMADSVFNAAELTDAGYKNVQVLPLIIDFEKLRSAPDQKALRKFDDGKTNVIFVGRCAPNKKLEDVLMAFFHFQKSVEPDSRFIHVGSSAGTERYLYLLLARAKELGIANFSFSGALPQSQLNAIYQSADIFLSMSEHEGFCIPILESMMRDVPVMAYSSSAIPETMDGAGILFGEKRYDMIAELMGRVVSDSAFNSALIAGQRERMKRFIDRDLVSELGNHLAPLLK